MPVTQAQKEIKSDLVLDFGFELPVDISIYCDGKLLKTVSKDERAVGVDVPWNSWESAKPIVIGLESKEIKGQQRVFVLPKDLFSKQSGRRISVKCPLPIFYDLVVSANRETHSGFIMAGDRVSVELVGRDFDDEILDPTNGLSALSIAWFTLPNATKTAKGISETTQETDEHWPFDMWQQIRDQVGSALANGVTELQKQQGVELAVASVNAEGLSEQIDGFRYLGSGPLLSWFPAGEGDVRLFALVNYRSGIWSVYTRDFSIKDLRPVCWLVPELKPIIDDQLAGLIGRLGNSIRDGGIKPFTGRQISQLMSKIQYEAQPNQIVKWNVVFDPYYPASLPVRSLTIAVDGVESKNMASQGKSGVAYSAPIGDICSHEAHLIVVDEAGITYTNTVQVSVVKPENDYSLVVKESPSSRDLFMAALDKWSTKVTDFIIPMNETLAIREAEGIDGSLVDLFNFSLVDKLIRQKVSVVEREEKWLKVLNDERNYQLDLIASKYGSAISNPSMQIKYLDEIQHLGGANQKTAQQLLSFKIKRAMVKWFQLGPVMFREADIQGWVRIHDLKSYDVLKQSEISSSVGDKSISLSIPMGADPNIVDVYEENMLLYPAVPELAIEVVKPANVTPPPSTNDKQVPTAIPAASPMGSKRETKPGGNAAIGAIQEQDEKDVIAPAPPQKRTPFQRFIPAMP